MLEHDRKNRLGHSHAQDGLSDVVLVDLLACFIIPDFQLSKDQRMLETQSLLPQHTFWRELLGPLPHPTREKYLSSRAAATAMLLPLPGAVIWKSVEPLPTIRGQMLAFFQYTNTVS